MGRLNCPEGYGFSGKTKAEKYNFKNPVYEYRWLKDDKWYRRRSR
jgi:hypothetical protein